MKRAGQADAERALKRPLISVITFERSKTFAAYTEAKAYAESMGYSVGRMCVPAPIAIKRGDYDIAKWNNLTPGDLVLMDGVLLGDMRNGPVSMLVAKSPLEILAEEG